MNTPSKAPQIAIVIIAILIVAGAYWYAGGSAFFRASSSARSTPTRNSAQLPANPNITAHQQALYTDRLSATSSQQQVARYFGTAVSTAVATSTIILSASCQPNVPSVKMFSDRKITFINTAEVAQELVIGPKHVTIGSRGRATLTTKEIVPDYKPVNGIKLRGYTCAGSSFKTTGFLVFFPD
ncbi:MAG TPA: hypothetical protein VF438_02255 [Candidatus Paceibacterota bacterium]